MSPQKTEREIRLAVKKLYDIYDRNEYGPNRDHVEHIIHTLEWVLGEGDVVNEVLELLS